MTNKRTEIINRLINLNKEANKKWNELEDAGIEIRQLSDVCEGLDDMILDLVGLPEDSTLKYKFGDPRCFCRDYWTDLLYEYYEGVISIHKLMSELKKANKRYA